MLDRALAQPSQNGSLSFLALFAQRVVHIAAFFSFCGQRRCRTQVCLISKHDEKFCLLAIGSMLNYPRRDLEVEPVVLNVLAGRTRGADPPYNSDGGCDEQDKTKNNPQSGRGCAVWVAAHS